MATNSKVKIGEIDLLLPWHSNTQWNITIPNSKGSS